MTAAAPKPDIDTCAECGKLFPRVYIRLCGTCALNAEARFRLVRAWLEENPGAIVSEIAEGTGLSRGEVARLFDNGRLVAAGGTGSDLLGAVQGCTCKNDGVRCAHCRRELARKFDAPPAPASARKTLGEIAREGQPRVTYIRRVHREGE